MSKLNWLKFYPRDWYSDAKLMTCAPSTRGLWIDFLSVMWVEGSPEVKGSVADLARLGRAGNGDVTQFVADAKRTRFCDLAQQGSVYIIRSRRFLREFDKRVQGRERVREYRERNADVTLFDAPLKRTETETDAEADRPSDRGIKSNTRISGSESQSSPNGKLSKVVTLLRLWPADLLLTPEMISYAKANGVEQAESEFEAWRDDCAAHGRKYRDWSAAWRMRIRRVPDFTHRNGARVRATTGVDITKELMAEAVTRAEGEK